MALDEPHNKAVLWINTWDDWLYSPMGSWGPGSNKWHQSCLSCQWIASIMEHLLYAKAGQNIWCVLFHSVLPATFWQWDYYYSHFTDETVEVQIVALDICLWLPWWLNGRAGFKWPWWSDLSFTSNFASPSRNHCFHPVRKWMAISKTIFLCVCVGGRAGGRSSFKIMWPSP